MGGGDAHALVRRRACVVGDLVHLRALMRQAIEGTEPMLLMSETAEISMSLVPALTFLVWSARSSTMSHSDASTLRNGAPRTIFSISFSAIGR